MDVILKDELRQARKVYPCDACATWHGAGMSTNDCASAEELLILQAAEADRWKILRGQTYRYVRGVWEGHMATWRERPGMGALVRRHELYE